MIGLNFSAILSAPPLPRMLRFTALSLSPLLMASSEMAAGFKALSGGYYNGCFYENLAISRQYQGFCAPG